MRSPFPGMDPYLEHPALWPDPHNSLIIAISDAIVPRLAPRYYVGLGRRAYTMGGEDFDFPVVPQDRAGVAKANADDRVSESYLEVREVGTGLLVTLLEILSPTNKLHPVGREQYEAKRINVLGSRTNLVEIDLLRDGEPMEVVGGPGRGGYRILVSRAWRRPKAMLQTFGLRAAIPTFPLPLRQGEDEPPVELNAILHALYDRARFDLRLDYRDPPVPPLDGPDSDWSRGLIGGGTADRG